MGSVQALWDRRDLVGALASSQFKGRYRRLGLGVAWAVINPIVQAVLIAVVFHYLVRFKLEFPYALLVLTGIMPWNFLVTAIAAGTTSVLDSASIVERVSLPRVALPTATIIVSLLNFAFMLATLLVITAVLAPGRLGWIWLLPPAVAIQVALLYGIVLVTSTLHVRYRDVGQLVQAATLAWFWATPVIYPMSVLGGRPLLEGLARANPMTGVISLYRAAFLHLPIDGWAVIGTLGWTVVFLVAGWRLFLRRESTIADFI